MASVILLAILSGCAPGPATLAREGRLPEAWRAACKREPEDHAAPGQLLSREERALLRPMLLARTHGSFTARAISQSTLHQRLGEKVFPRDMLLLVTHLDVSAHPGAGIHITPRLVIGGAPLVEWGGRDAWRLAEVEPPQAASLGSYNLAGALLDAVVAGVTLGAVDPEWRGQKDVLPTISAGSPGTGTPLQRAVLFQLMVNDRHCSIVHLGRIGRPCDAFYLLATGKPQQPEYVPVLLDDASAPPTEDALVLHVGHSADRYSDAYCSLGYTIVLPLPEGPDVASRINALFARGPVELGGPARSPR